MLTSDHAIFQAFGTGSIAQVVLSGKIYGEWLSINLGWGFGIMFGCYIAMGVSGAHMNPAVTLAMGKLICTFWQHACMLLFNLLRHVKLYSKQCFTLYAKVCGRKKFIVVIIKNSSEMSL